MLNNKIIAVIKREVRAQVMSTSFIIMTVLMPLLMFGIMALQIFLATYDDKTKMNFDVVLQSDSLVVDIKKALDKEALEKDANFTYSLTTKSTDIKDYVNSKKDKLLEGTITGVIYIPDSAMSNKDISYYSQNPNNQDAFGKVRTTFNNILVERHFNGRSLSQNDLSFINKRLNFTTYKITKADKLEEEGYGNLIVSMIFTMFLFISILAVGMNVMRAVTEEKINRVVEVLLSSLSSRDLMSGKIIGSTLTGLLQMTIWVTPIALIGFTAIIPMTADFQIQITPSLILYFMINYVIGLVTYLAIFAAYGAIFDNDQDAQQGIMPLMMLILIPFYLTIFTIPRNPANGIAEIASMVPFFSIMVMPARLACIDVPTWQLILCVLVNLFTMVGAIIASGKIYKVGVLLTGKKPSMKEIYTWLKQA